MPDRPIDNAEIDDVFASTVDFVHFAAKNVPADALPDLLVALADLIDEIKAADKAAKDRWLETVNIGDGVIVGGRAVRAKQRVAEHWDNLRLIDLLAGHFADDNGLDRDGNPIPPRALLTGFGHELADVLGLRRKSHSPNVTALRARRIDPDGPWKETVPTSRTVEVGKRDE